MIEVKNVYKKFKKQISKKETIDFYADSNISFTASPGEVVGILGPNGAGKTTLLRMIAGIMTPTKGEILVDERSHKKDSISIKKDIAFLTGNTKLYKDISPYELLKMCGEYYDIPKEQLEKRIDDIIKRFNMENFKHQRIETLSTGQYQRTGISRCLIHNPKYYILDEPTSGLDVISSKVILDFVKEEKEKGKCILYSTHYMEEAADADYVVILDAGSIAAEGTPLELKNKYTGDFITLYSVSEEGATSLGLPLEPVPGAYRVEVPDTAAATRLILEHPHIFTDFEITKGKMDDVFLAVTGKKLSADEKADTPGKRGRKK